MNARQENQMISFCVLHFAFRILFFFLSISLSLSSLFVFRYTNLAFILFFICQSAPCDIKLKRKKVTFQFKIAVWYPTTCSVVLLSQVGLQCRQFKFNFNFKSQTKLATFIDHERSCCCSCSCLSRKP